MATVNTHSTERRHLLDRRSGVLRNTSAGASGLNVMDWIAMLLLIVGGLNWGLIGLFDFNLVASLFGPMTLVSRVVYGLVGLAGLYAIYLCTRLAGKPDR